jgi:Sec-independent protein translocase protein TatA
MNFSISEMLVVLLIALLVIKPEQLPDVAFTLGKFAQSLQRLFAKIKEEMNSLTTLPAELAELEEEKREQFK